MKYHLTAFTLTLPLILTKPKQPIEMKKKRDPVGNEIRLFVLPFTEKWRDELMYFCYFIGFGSVGTDGARTRSFRLDRAVL